MEVFCLDVRGHDWEDDASSLLSGRGANVCQLIAIWLQLAALQLPSPPCTERQCQRAVNWQSSCCRNASQWRCSPKCSSAECGVQGFCLGTFVHLNWGFAAVRALCQFEVAMVSWRGACVPLLHLN